MFLLSFYLGYIVSCNNLSKIVFIHVLENFVFVAWVPCPVMCWIWFQGTHDISFCSLAKKISQAAIMAKE